MMPLILIHRLDSDESGYSPVGPLDDAYSVVWTERWQDYGEAQIRAPPGCPAEAGDLVSMVGRSMSAEIVGRTETEKGVELRCRDALSVLDRRIVYPMVKNDGLVSTFITKMLQNGDIVGDGTQTGDRALKPVRIGDLSAITASAVLQRTYEPMGESILALGRTYGFDPMASLSSKHIVISARVNSSSREWMSGGGLAGYVEDYDESQSKNVAYVAGQNYGAGRVTSMVNPAGMAGWPAGMDRHEVYVDRRDIVTQGPRPEIETLYGELEFDNDPSDPGYDPDDPFINAQLTVRGVQDFTDPIILGAEFQADFRAGSTHAWAEVIAEDGRNEWFLDWLVENFDGRYIPSTGVYETEGYSYKAGSIWYWKFPGGIGGGDLLIPMDFVFANSPVIVDPYSVFNPIGEETLADAVPTQAFGASVEGMKPYEDYCLGDTVRIIKRPGDIRTMRVAEIVESWDSQGYRATPNLANI